MTQTCVDHCWMTIVEMSNFITNHSLRENTAEENFKKSVSPEFGLGICITKEKYYWVNELIDIDVGKYMYYKFRK